MRSQRALLSPRRARPLVGLLLPFTAACGLDVGPVAWPLVDLEGAPACGNIGQAGRPSAERPAALPLSATPVTASVAAAAPSPSLRAASVLVRPPAPRETTDACAARPLVDLQSCDPACGNVMTKGGCDRGR